MKNTPHSFIVTDEELVQQKIENFKRSLTYMALEQASLISENLMHRNRDEEDMNQTLLDLDSESGQQVCKSFLSCVERLNQILNLRAQPRDYRANFSASYKVLYENQQAGPVSSTSNIDNFCYLTEILDSAQESLPHLWVNGEKYIFSESVVDAGTKLYQDFSSLKSLINAFYTDIEKSSFSSGPKLTNYEDQLTEALTNFDKTWTHYENVYVVELMVIENDARRFIVEALQTEAGLQKLETEYKSKPLKTLLANTQYLELRKASV